MNTANSSPAVASPVGSTSVSEYTIPQDSMGSFRKEISRLARKAEKQGFKAPTFEVIGMVVKTVEVRDEKRVVPCDIVRLTSEPFAIQGFRFVARLEHVSYDGSGTIVHAVPGEEVPAQYRNASGQWCDHCRAKRSRNDTFLLRKDEDGSYVQVGRQCVVDYIGQDASNVAAAFQGALYAIHIAKAHEWDDSFGEGGSVRSHLMVSYYLPIVAYAVREYGWISRKAASESGGQSTCDLCYSLMGKVRPLDEDYQLSEKVIEWAKGLPDDCNDYLHNLRVLADTNVLRSENMGLAASMIAAYNNAHAPRYGANSQHVGEVGGRMVVRLRVDRIHTFYTEFGASHLHVMSDESENVFIWKASTAPLKQGETYLLKGTVKAHNDREGVKQTILSRCEEVCFSRWIVTVNGSEHEIEAESDKAAKEAAKVKLGLSRMPKGVTVRLA